MTCYQTTVARIYRMLLNRFLLFSGFLIPGIQALHSQQPAPFVYQPLQDTAALTTAMVQGIDRFLTATAISIEQRRLDNWDVDFTSRDAFEATVAPKRALLAERLGVVDDRTIPNLRAYTGSLAQPVIVETDRCIIRAVNWQVLSGLSANGLLLRPKGKITGSAVMLPDADQLPEVLAGIGPPNSPGFGAALKLADAGWMVLIPLPVSRSSDYSGNPDRGLYAKLTHREWIYRQAYMVGRHVIGYELQKIFAAIDWLQQQHPSSLPVGVAGYGEGGLLALYAAALDTRINTTLVSGYFNNRSNLWTEPIYRNVFGLLRHFGDAELATLVWPRRLVIEHAIAPERASFGGAASPGTLTTPAQAAAKKEFDRAVTMLPPAKLHLHWTSNGDAPFQTPFSPAALGAFAQVKLAGSGTPLTLARPVGWPDPEKQQEQTVREMTAEVQRTYRLAEYTRQQNFWERLPAKTQDQAAVKDSLRQQLWDQLGRLPAPSSPFNTHAMILEQTPQWTSYIVKLDVWDEVYTWGILVVPTNIPRGEKRPVVVCQHGLEQSPFYLINTDSSSRQFDYYQAIPYSLAEKGYVTFMPANPYYGGDRFRMLQRKANPLGLSIFSVIIGQHQRIVEWLQQLSFADADRIGFMGLSYGGVTALRVPPIVKGYALSICIANYNDWVEKCVSVDLNFSYMYNAEYEIQDWDLGRTFNTAEMAALVAPRPFMAQRGSFDGIATDEMFATEYARLRRHYMLSGIPEDRIDMKYFVGGHVTEKASAIAFIERHLGNRAQ